jgi:hypothetical protein
MKKATGKRVIARAYSGVFLLSLLEKRSIPGGSIEVDYEWSIHIWNWTSDGLPRKAITVEDLALIGAGKGSRVSGKSPPGTLADIKVVVSATSEACERIEALSACL